MKLSQISPPPQLQRNCHLIGARKLQDVGEYLISFATQELGYSSLEDKDILDVGCGIRFTEVIINRDIPVKTYTGVENYQPLIDYLKPEVQAKDSRFFYHYWNRHNELYNNGGVKMQADEQMPVQLDHFDVAWMFSVITHQNPEDSRALFSIIRKHVKPEGKLLFTAFIQDVDEFTDLNPEKPMSIAVYNEVMMRDLVESTGWQIEKIIPAHEEGWHQATFVCSKA